MCLTKDHYKDKGIDSDLIHDDSQIYRNDPQMNWKATYSNGSKHCTQVEKNGSDLTANMGFYRYFLTNSVA